MNPFSLTVARAPRLHLIPGVPARIAEALSAVADHVVAPNVLLDHKPARGTVPPVPVLDQLQHRPVLFRVAHLALRPVFFTRET